MNRLRNLDWLWQLVAIIVGLAVGFGLFLDATEPPAEKPPRVYGIPPIGGPYRTVPIAGGHPPQASPGAIP